MLALMLYLWVMFSVCSCGVKVKFLHLHHMAGSVCSPTPALSQDKDWDFFLDAAKTDNVLKEMVFYVE